jgi:hypothetical protein
MVANMIGRITALEWYIVRQLLADYENEEIPLLEKKF